MGYEELLIEADKDGLIVKEAPLQSSDGLCKGKRIAIRRDLSFNKKGDTLAEEMGHYHTAVGNILDQNEVSNRKQERAGRLYAYNKRIGLTGIINAFKAHYNTTYEIAEYLEVSEEFLTDALECYRQIYGNGQMVDNYVIKFEPNLQVYEYFTIA